MGQGGWLVVGLCGGHMVVSPSVDSSSIFSPCGAGLHPDQGRQSLRGPDP